VEYQPYFKPKKKKYLSSLPVIIFYTFTVFVLRILRLYQQEKLDYITRMQVSMWVYCCVSYVMVTCNTGISNDRKKASITFIFKKGKRDDL